jgi:hypothetical protein
MSDSRTDFLKVANEYPTSTSNNMSGSDGTKRLIRLVLLLGLLFFLLASSWAYNKVANYLKFPDTNINIPYQLTMVQAALFAIVVFIVFILFK